MSKKERMHHFYQGKPVDRVPFMSSATMYSGKCMGLNSKEFYYDIEKSFHAQEFILKLHHCDGDPCLDLPNGEVLDFGGKIFFDHEDRLELPKVAFPITTLNEAIDYRLPPQAEWRFLQQNIDFAKYAQGQGVGGASITAGSPFTMLGSLVDLSTLMVWLLEEPEVVHKLLDQMVDYLIRRGESMIGEFGLENCSVSGNVPLENNDILSSKMMEEFSLPYTKKVYDYFRERGIKSFGLHFCGNHNKNLEYYKTLNLNGGSFISVDERTDIEQVAKTLGQGNIIAGNVSSQLLVSGNPREVYQHSGEIIKKMKYHEGGFVLMPSCDLPLNTKSVNLNAMYQACLDYGSYI